MNDFELTAENLAETVAGLTASQQAEIFTLLEELEEITEGRNGLTVCLAVGLMQCRLLQEERMRSRNELN